MGIFVCIRQYFDDLCIWIANNKRKFWACCIVALVGVAMGIVAFVNCSQNWWYHNRCNYLNLLVRGNFFLVLLSLISQTVVICVIVMASCAIKHLSILRILLIFTCSFYVGANMSCAFHLFGMVAIIFLLLYFLVEILCALSLCYTNNPSTDYFKSLCEVWQDSKSTLFCIVILNCVKLLLLFLILRPIFASI